MGNTNIELEAERLFGDDEKIIIYTDGSCSCNPGPGGYATVLMFKGHKKIVRNSYEQTTNNEMELMAVYEGLKQLKKQAVVNVYTDSGYVHNIFNSGWLERWKENNWLTAKGKPVVNKELIQQIDEIRKQHSVNFILVRGHSGNLYNEICNIMAQHQTKKIIAEKKINIEELEASMATKTTVPKEEKYHYDKYDYSLEYRSNEVKFLKGFIEILDNTNEELEAYLNVNHNMSFYKGYEKWFQGKREKTIEKKQKKEKRKKEKKEREELEKEEQKSFAEKENLYKQKLLVDFRKAQFGKNDVLKANQFLKIIPKYQCYFGYGYSILNNMPTWKRKTLGNTYYESMETTLKLMFELKDQTKKAKLEILRKIDAQIALQITLIEYMHELFLMTNKKKDTLINMLAEIGRMIGGLKKAYGGIPIDEIPELVEQPDIELPGEEELKEKTTEEKEEN